MVEGGYDLGNEKFSELSRLIQDDNGVIEAYELAQGGTGSLLFDPIYTKDENGKQQFWGFSLAQIIT